MSFGTQYIAYSPRPFPLLEPLLLVIAPYWADLTLDDSPLSTLKYTTYTTQNGLSYINQVNEFLADFENETITVTMILVAQWIDVCAYPCNTNSPVSILIS